MYTRALAGAAALALAAGSHAAISVSFASGSANQERIFELTQGTTPRGFDVITVETVENVEVDLIVNMGGGTNGLFTQRAGFEAMFYIDQDFDEANGGGPFAIGGDLNGYFRFYDPNDIDDTLLVGFVDSGLGIFVLADAPANGTDFGFIAGSLVGPGTSYFLDDPEFGSALGFPGGGIMGDSAFTLTNFAEMDDMVPLGDQPFAMATGSFSGTLIPSTGSGVLSALAMGVVAIRRRR